MSLLMNFFPFLAAVSLFAAPVNTEPEPCSLAHGGDRYRPPQGSGISLANCFWLCSPILAIRPLRKLSAAFLSTVEFDLKTILMSFATSRQVKELVVDLLDQMASNTDNRLDDRAAKAVRAALLGDAD